MKRPRLGVWKFASCDGCQLSLLDAESELLRVAEALEIAYFAEATRKDDKGRYDIALLDGSVATPEDQERVRDIRRRSRFLVAIGTCATSGGIQALRNFHDVKDYLRAVYPRPGWIPALDTSTPHSQHVKVDYELQGCPVDHRQLTEVLRAFLAGGNPSVRAHSVCLECKRRQTTCILVAADKPCMGPVTHAGCGAICPAYGRACYGCFGPAEDPNTGSLVRHFKALGFSDRQLRDMFRRFYANAPAFREAAERAAQERADWRGVP